MTLATVSDSAVLARIGTALSDASRRRILLELLDGARYPGELAATLGCSKANVSNHLACLRGCGIVRATPEGRRVRYELSDARLKTALSMLCGLTLDIDPHCHGG